MVATPIGFRLREARKKKGLTQTKLAKEVGISVSYLNLIEHNKRSIAGRLLNKIAVELELDPGALSGLEDARLMQNLTEVASEPLFRNLGLSEHGAQSIVSHDPAWARAIVRLHAAWRSANDLVEALSDQLNRDPYVAETSHEILTYITAIRSFSEILEDNADLPDHQRQRFISLLAGESVNLSNSATDLFRFMSVREQHSRPTTPAGEVEDFIIDNDNHFPRLESAAADLRGRMEAEGLIGASSVAQYLTRRHGVEIKEGELTPDATAHPVSPPHYAFDRERRSLVIRPSLPNETLKFQLLRVAFELEFHDLVSVTAANAMLSSDDARNRGLQALARYGAGATLLPYEPVLAAAEATRYDIQALAARFGASFEQVCHRLVTLKRPGQRAVPFAFMRVDPAGNISKRFSLPDLRLPRHGGACSLWPVYSAFQTPGRVVPQLINLPDDRRFLIIARTVSKEAQVFGEPPQIYSVMLACNAAYAGRVVYGDVLDLDGGGIGAGVNCRLCPRNNCSHRAHAKMLAMAD